MHNFSAAHPLVKLLLVTGLSRNCGTTVKLLQFLLDARITLINSGYVMYKDQYPPPPKVSVQWPEWWGTLHLHVFLYMQGKKMHI